MKFVNKHLKEAGYFNTALIAIAIILRIINFPSDQVLTKIDSIVCIAALIFGLVYSFNGYKKDAAKYYKIFMYLYLLSSLVAVSTYFEGTKLIIFISNIIVSICLFVLAFAKDIGKEKSNFCALLTLALSLAKLLFALQGPTNMAGISAEFASVALACVLCVFVSAKYKDKEARGSK